MISVIIACLWLIIAQVVALFPSKDHHWRFAYFLIALGVPILAFVWREHGLLITGVFLVAGMSILRYPVLYAYRWVRRTLGTRARD